MIALIVGCVLGACVLVYSSLKPISQAEIEETKRKKEDSKRRLTREEIKERKDSTREMLKENMMKANPGMQNLTDEQLAEQVKNRKEAFLSKMDDRGREAFLNLAKEKRKLMEEFEAMNEDEIRQKVTEIEANEFRVYLIKFIIIGLLSYLFLMWNYDTPSIFELREHIMKDFIVFRSSYFGGPGIMKSISMNQTTLEQDL